ncbi:Putative short-chain type dehydrogenase/reductase/MSMEI_5872 [Baekduia alba]|nr:Putative short-chain type dehydrogenase/reductase/MSMEI_5872 [Baekduia alba]
MLAPMTELMGRVAFVTGAARGQGRAHALALAEAGADLVICDLADGADPSAPYALSTSADLEETAGAVRALGRRCVAGVADVTDEAALRALVERAVAELGRLDAVVANAGIVGRPGPSWELSEEDWDRVLAVNLKGVWLTCKVALPALLAAGGGSIVVISSIGGLKGQPGMAAYVAAKHGAIGLTRTIANEVGAAGVRVNAVCPGAVDTPMVTNQATLDLFSGAAAGEGTRATLEAALAGQVLLRPGFVAPADVSAAVVWLTSDAARWVTGAVLPVDAGMAAKAA